VRGDHDDGGIRALAQPPAYLDAIEVGQFEIEQDDVRLGPAERVPPVSHVLDLIAAPRQRADQLGGDGRVIFDDENARGRLARTRGQIAP
jgi:hypothetical protein